ncbi:ATP-binding protein [Streptomyces nitrosporeus]|uniref:sensor histidine kinase n=1 Tax=Streptomyces nitrosporeus TaxID=28894 RepID=UPI00399F3B48
MSQLRAPAARPERREGGRHGRPGGRSHPAASRPRTPRPAPEARMRPQILRAALLPAVAAALSGAAAVIFTIRFSGVRPSGSLLAVLGGSGALAVAAVAAALVGAGRVCAAVSDRALALRRTTARHHAELQRVMELLRDGGPVPERDAARHAGAGEDPFDLLAHEMDRGQDAAVAALVEASRLSHGTGDERKAGDEQKVEVFVNLARRLQSLVHREIQILDELEHEVEDPDLLKGLFQVDHLATRIRRHAENLAVLGGAVSRRQWSSPVSMVEVLRSATAEVEQYPRVKLVPPVDGTLNGHAVADVIHLLAELVENATVFSAPHTQVLLRAQRVTAGLALEVEDRGLGMPGHEQKRMNTLLNDPDRVDVAHLLQDGRIGLFVVASLARRHGIAVRLQSNIYGGTQAVLVLPEALLGADEDPGTAGDAVPGAVPRAQPADVHRPPAGGGTAAPPAASRPRQEPPRLDRPPRQAGDAYEHRAPHPERVDVPGPAAPPAGRPAGPVTGGTPPERTADAVGPPPGPVGDRFTAAHTGDGAPAAYLAGAPYAGGGTTTPPRHGEGTALFGGTAEGTPGGAPAGDGRTAAGAAADGTGAANGSTARPPEAARPETPARPRLPRRSNQEHLAPQLKEAPAPRAFQGETVLHDPGLMAAFRRGVDLAEAQTADEDPVAPAPARETTPHTTGVPAPPEAAGPRRPPHGLAPLPVRGPAASGAVPAPAFGELRMPAPDPRPENTFKE